MPSEDIKFKIYKGITYLVETSMSNNAYFSLTDTRLHIEKVENPVVQSRGAYQSMGLHFPSKGTMFFSPKWM